MSRTRNEIEILCQPQIRLPSCSENKFAISPVHKSASGFNNSLESSSFPPSRGAASLHSAWGVSRIYWRTIEFQGRKSISSIARLTQRDRAIAWWFRECSLRGTVSAARTTLCGKSLPCCVKRSLVPSSQGTCAPCRRTTPVEGPALGCPPGDFCGEERT